MSAPPKSVAGILRRVTIRRGSFILLLAVAGWIGQVFDRVHPTPFPGILLTRHGLGYWGAMLFTLAGVLILIHGLRLPRE